MKKKQQRRRRSHADGGNEQSDVEFFNGDHLLIPFVRTFHIDLHVLTVDKEKKLVDFKAISSGYTPSRCTCVC